MALPQKEILRLRELMSRWNKDCEYVKHLIITKQLPVWGFFNNFYKTFDNLPISGSEEDELFFMGVKPIKGYFKLEGLEQTSASDFYFTHFFITEEKDYQLRAGYDDELNCTSKNIDEWALFKLEDVLNIEEENSPAKTSLEFEKPLHSREKNNLLKIIAALCTDQGLDIESPYKAATLIENQIKTLGLSLKEDKIAAILKSVSDVINAAKNPN